MDGLYDKAVYEAARTLVNNKAIYATHSTLMADISRCMKLDTEFLLAHMNEGERIQVTDVKSVVKENGKIVTKFF